MSTTRTLILMRHAKSDYPGGVGDHDRPLADRGRHEAALAGEWLRAQHPHIDAVLCSTAVRTVQTVETARIEAPVRLAAEIYDATPDDILQQVRMTPPATLTLLVVGHAPGVPGLAIELSGSDSDASALTEVRARFPTAAIAVAEFDLDWSELDFADARLTALHIPRN